MYRINVVSPRAELITNPKEIRKQIIMCAAMGGLSRGGRIGRKIAWFDSILDGTADEEQFKEAFDESQKFLGKLLSKKPFAHESVLEHSAISFIVKCSRSISHQLVRHRHTAYTQESTRYVRYFVIDEESFHRRDYAEIVLLEGAGSYEFTNLNDESVPFMVRSSARSIEDRGIAEDHGVDKDEARKLMPHTLATQVGVTTNFSEYRHIMAIRMQPDASREFNIIASSMFIAFNEICPVITTGLPI